MASPFPRELGAADLPPVAIALPSLPFMWLAAVGALLQLRVPPGSGWLFEANLTIIADKRNWLVEQFLAQTECDWLLMLDTDMTPAPDTLERLLRRAIDEQLDVLSALYFMRGAPWQACAGFLMRSAETESVVGPQFLQPKYQTLCTTQRVHWAAFGFMLLHRRALERIAAPRFAPWGSWGNEEAWFGEQCRKAGVAIYVATDVVVPHLGLVAIGRREYEQLEQGLPVGARSGSEAIP